MMLVFPARLGKIVTIHSLLSSPSRWWTLDVERSIDLQLARLLKIIGSKGADEIKNCVLVQGHPWFKGIDWDKIYNTEAAFIPEVKDELDTRNFEKFEEPATQMQTTTKPCLWRK